MRKPSEMLSSSSTMRMRFLPFGGANAAYLVLAPGSNKVQECAPHELIAFASRQPGRHLPGPRSRSWRRGGRFALAVGHDVRADFDAARAAARGYGRHGFAQEAGVVAASLACAQRGVG